MLTYSLFYRSKKAVMPRCLLSMCFVYRGNWVWLHLHVCVCGKYRAYINIFVGARASRSAAYVMRHIIWHITVSMQRKTSETRE